jgi:hypothetical protein
MIAADVPAGTLACREYSHPLPEGRAASIIIILVRNDTEVPSARLARLLKARAHGRVSILDYPHGPRRPLVWFQTEDQLGLCLANGDEGMAVELRQIVAWYLSTFFLDIAAVDPELSRFDFEAKNKGSSRLN